MKKVYISGNLDGETPVELTRKLNEAAALLRRLGYEPVSPLLNGLPPGAGRNERSGRNIGLLLGCDAVWMLPDWRCSFSARLEHAVARHVGLERIYQCVGSPGGLHSVPLVGSGRDRVPADRSCSDCTDAVREWDGSASAPGCPPDSFLGGACCPSREAASTRPYSRHT